MAESQDSMNPYEGFKLLRDHAPVTRLEDDGPWQVARHADVHTILRDHETYSSQVSTRPQEERGAPSVLFSDPPIHNRLGKLVSVAFKPGQCFFTASHRVISRILPIAKSSQQKVN